jgi:hypothetical protein
MKLRQCTCGIECTTLNVTFLPLVSDGELIYFNCPCHSTLTINSTCENYWTILDSLIFKEMDDNKETANGRYCFNRK